MDRIVDLEKWLAEASSLEERIDALNALAWELRDRDPQRAHDLAQQSLASANKQDRSGEPYPKGKALALLTLGELSTRRETLGLALTFLQEAYGILESLPDLEIRADAAHSIGWAHFLMENFSESFEYLHTALMLFQQIGLREKEAAVQTSIGTVYSQTGSHAQAMEAFQLALQILDEKPASRSQAIALNNLSIAQIRIGNYPEALRNAQKGLNILRTLELHALEGSILETLSQAQFYLEDLSTAEETLLKSLALSREIGANSAEMEALMSLSKVYQRQGRLVQASELLLQTLQLADQRQLHNYQYRCHELLAKIYEESGQFEPALFHYRQFHAAMESSLMEAARFRVENLKVLYQVEKIRKEAEILKLQNTDIEREIEDRRRAHSELEKQAVTDPLTGLFNRRHLLTLGEYELENIRKSDGKFSMIMLDIDHFKQVNDTYTHSSGDQVLIQIAHQIKDASRKDDLCFRYGGEEFIILLLGTGFENAVEIAERIRTAVAGAPIQAHETTISVTVSLGVTQASAQDADLLSILERTDQALYLAKTGGRNQVAVRLSG